jgi:hypothetical protein
MVLECYYLSNGLKQQIYCVNDWHGKIHLIFTAAASPNIRFSVFGIRQDSTAIMSYLLLVGINSANYYYS